MSPKRAALPVSKFHCLLMLLALLGLLALPSGARAQSSEEHDNYKLKIDGFWFYSNPVSYTHLTLPTTPYV